jgi:23S rRNA pseudouridine1911/1915/1917 synthase
MNKNKELTVQIPAEFGGMRLDKALARLFPEITRSRLQTWIRAGRVEVSHSPTSAAGIPSPASRPSFPLSPREAVIAGDLIRIHVPPPTDAGWMAQDIPLAIVYEDPDILVIDKPPGLVVHPGAGNPSGTLLNALLNHVPGLGELPRAGIVHRLDKDTSGLMVVAKKEAVRQKLIKQLQDRSVERVYLAIVNGVMVSGGTIDAPIGRHRTQRVRMVVSSRGKPAVSHYRVLKKYRAHTLVQIKLESGRTHQIRVHMAHLHYPVVGDPVYGGRLKIPADASDTLKDALHRFRRQALHALKLSLIHPETGKRIQWVTSVPRDMSELMEMLNRDSRLRSN